MKLMTLKVIGAILLPVCVFAMVALSLTTIKADPVTTSVTVGNSAPSITAGPAESTDSDGTTPTNAGSGITFQAIASDSNNEDYYLAICKTNSITATNGGAPTCGGGNWCISSATDSGTQASCSYTTLSGDSESNDWYGFVCDDNASSAACSSANQGSGSSGSPFKVNHAPTFATISNNSPQDPGASITWSTNTSTTDSDTDTIADTVKLVICKTTGLSNGDCDGGASDRWCQSSLVANDPSCSYSVPTPTADQTYAAYAYIVDNHNFGASGVNQEASSDYVVNNVAPVVSAVTLNAGSDITLTEGTTTAIAIGGTVTDNNSCQDLSAVESSLYRSAVTYASCDDNAEDNDNSCYAVITCSVVGAGNTCSGASDASADYECSVSIQYHADATVTGTIYPTETWLSTVKATDDDAATNSAEVSAGVEMNTLVAYDVTATIGYGNLNVGQKNDPLDKITTITATGNVGLDQELSGDNMTSGSDSIAVSYQKYALASSTAYASGSSLSGSATEVELNCQKTTSNASPATKDTWWGLEIPAGTPPGTYSGANTIIAVLGETANW